MKRAIVVVLSVAAAGPAPAAFAQPSAPQTLPSLPGSNGPAPAAVASPDPAAGAPAALPTPQQLYEHVRRGVAIIERAGTPLAIGTVLANDGRILTALSGLGGGESADVRYADGTVVHTKLGHSDKANDLALLVPQAAKGVAARWKEGLGASHTNPATADLRAMLPARGGALGPAEADVKGHADAHARDGEPLSQMLDVDVKGPLIAGAPVLDSTGSVVAVLVRACRGAAPAAAPSADASPWAAWAAQASGHAKAAPCAPAVLGASVEAIRSFLAHTPAAAAVPAPWLGIRGEPAAGATPGVRVLAVAPQSPAEKSGLKPGADVIVAVGGEPVASPEKLSEAIAKRAVGETVKLLVFGDDKFREVTVALQPAP